MYEKRDLTLQGANFRLKELETEVAQLRDAVLVLQRENEKLHLKIDDFLKNSAH